MKRLTEIEKDVNAMGTLADLTNVFQGIASMRISQIKNQVLQATQFFNELWGLYSQLRVQGDFGFGRSQTDTVVSDKELFIIITAEGGFSGDIDQKLIELMLKTYDKSKNEIIVIGHHGAIQLAQRGVPYIKYFKLPAKDRNINVAPIIREVQKYTTTCVFYQEYISLYVQDVKKIELSSVVAQKGNLSDSPDEIVSESNYIFEPSTYAVVDHLERSMMNIAMSQLILDSKLAQYASRFRAMTTSNQRATDAQDALILQFSRVKRATKDERLKEIVNGLKKVRVAGI